MEVPHDDNKMFLDENKMIACQLGAGDMLLWDSRTVHCSYPSDAKITKTSQETHSIISDKTAYGLIRAATLVSMMPRSKATDEVIKERIRAVNAGRTLTHWANQVSPLGAEKEEEVAIESSRVALMKVLPGSVLLEFEDLSNQQQLLVTGSPCD